MTNREHDGDSRDLYAADVIGDSYPSALEISGSMSESEIRDTIQAKTTELLEIQIEIAKLQSQWQRTANERLLYSDAYRIARDKGLE